MNTGITVISDEQLQQVNGGGFWDTVFKVVTGPVGVIVEKVADNFINPSRVGDDPLQGLNAGRGGSDEDGGQEGAGGSGD